MGKMKQLWQERQELKNSISFPIQELNQFRDQLTSLEKKNKIPILSKFTQYDQNTTDSSNLPF